MLDIEGYHKGVDDRSRIYEFLSTPKGYAEYTSINTHITRINEDYPSTSYFIYLWGWSATNSSITGAVY
jgi:hypothetical protein